jgi:hypothetical protein
MPRLLQFIALLTCLVATRSLEAFSLLGVFETWQTQTIGYNQPGDIGAPKNLGEEYRWNAPIITYGFDLSFINYFGSNGVAAVDAAFDLLNALPDLSSLDPSLPDFPLLDPATGASTTYRDSRRVNLRAEADNLIDVKSMTLGLMMEQLGLGSPTRWTWSMSDRATFPNNTNYTVIERNFDPTTLTYSKYVNGTRYTYSIVEITPGPFQSDAIEAVVDPESLLHSFSAVADIGDGNIQGGVFYTTLTRDDIGGLRYIYNKNNLNWEPPPTNSLMFTVDRTSSTLVTNQDLSLLGLRSLTASPQLMQIFYPGLVINQATPSAITTNVIVPIISTQRVLQPFTTNFQNGTIVSNIDLATFSSVTLTSPPANVIANLQAAFPNYPSTNFDQLEFVNPTVSATTVVQVASIDVTNGPIPPWSTPGLTNFVLSTNFVTNILVLYHYSFQNVQTNYVSPTTTLQKITFGITPAPFSDASNPVYLTNTVTTTTNLPSGGIMVIPTNIVGYAFGNVRVTNVIGITNFLFITNVTDPNTGFTRTAGETDLTLFTNVQYFAFPIDFSTGLGFGNTIVTNGFVQTNITTYTYSFANVVTNYSGPGTPATRLQLQIVPDPNNPAFNRTNVIATEQTILPVASGGFLLDVNQTGFQFSGFSNVTVIPQTNIVFDVTDANGVRTIEEDVYNFTNTVYLVFSTVLTNPPAATLRPGISKLRFRRIGGEFSNFNGNTIGFSFTNTYNISFYTNGVLVNAGFQVVQGSPDILITAADLGTHTGLAGQVLYARTGAYQNNGNLNSVNAGEAGPGTINASTLTFSKLGPVSFNTFPGQVTEASTLSGPFAFARSLLWGSFDGSTNAPIVFPKDITLEQIELLITGGAVP